MLSSFLPLTLNPSHRERDFMIALYSPLLPRGEGAGG